MPTLPKDPFAGLFGGTETKKTTTIPSSGGVSQSNPFAGLFDAQEARVPSAPRIEPYIPEEIKSRNEVISAAEEPSFFSGIVNKAFDVLGFNKAAPIASEKQKKEVSDFVYNEMKADPVYSNPVLGIIKDTFIPTKIILSGQSPYVSEAQKRINTEFETEHPIISIMPKAVAGLANLLLVGKTGGGFGLSKTVTQAAGGLGRLAPTITRAIGMGAESGSIFGIESFISQALEQVQSRKLEPVKLAAETAKGTATGVALGAAGALPTLAGRVAGASGTLAGITAAEGYLADKKIDKTDLTNIAVSAFLGAGFEFFGGRKKTELFKAEEMQSIARELPISRIMANNPKMSRTEAEGISGLINYLSNYSKIAIYEQAPAKTLAQFEGLPKDFWSWKKDKKTNYFDSVSKEVLSGKSIAQSIENANAALGIEATLYDRQKELQEKVNTPDGQNDEAIIKELAEVSEAINSQQEQSQEMVLVVKRADGEDYAKISVLPIARQWGYSYDVDVDSASISSGFLSNELKATREAAVAAAKQDVLSWAEKQKTEVAGNEAAAAQLSEVIAQVKMVKAAAKASEEIKKPTTMIGNAQVELNDKGQIINVLASSSDISTSGKVSEKESLVATKSLPSQTSVLTPEPGTSVNRANLPSANLRKIVDFKSDIKNIEKLPDALRILYQRAIVKSVELDNKLDEIKKQIKDSDYFIRLKTTERSSEKFNAGQKVKDLLGSQFVVKDLSQIPAAKKLIMDNFPVKQVNDYFKEKNRWGYAGINLFIKDPSGFVYEIQIHTPQTRKAALEAHTIYEKWRVKLNDWSKITEADKIAIMKDQKKSRDIFDQALKVETKTQKEKTATEFIGQVKILADELEKYKKAGKAPDVVYHGTISLKVANQIRKGGFKNGIRERVYTSDYITAMDPYYADSKNSRIVAAIPKIGVEPKIDDKQYKTFDASELIPLPKDVDPGMIEDLELNDVEEILAPTLPAKKPNYSAERKQAEEFQREEAEKLKSPDYSKNVAAEYKAEEARRKEGLTFRENNLAGLSVSKIQVEKDATDFIKMRMKEAKISKEDFDLDRVDVGGSRVSGKPTDLSDLDARVYYRGKLSTDKVWDILRDVDFETGEPILGVGEMPGYKTTEKGYTANIDFEPIKIKPAPRFAKAKEGKETDKNTLIIEAKQYKTADEFVEAKVAEVFKLTSRIEKATEAEASIKSAKETIQWKTDHPNEIYGLNDKRILSDGKTGIEWYKDYLRKNEADLKKATQGETIDDLKKMRDLFLKNAGEIDTEKFISYWNEAHKPRFAKALTPIEKGGRNLMEFENADLTLPELNKKLEIAVEGKEDKDLISQIKADIAAREKPAPRLTTEQEKQVKNLLAGADHVDNPDVENIIQFHGTQKIKELKEALKNGTVKASVDGLMGKGFYLTVDKELAKYFGKQLTQGTHRIFTNNPVEVVAIDLRGLNIKTQPFGKGEYYEFLDKEKLTNEEYNNQLKAEGYDGLNLEGRGETIVWNVEKIKEYPAIKKIKDPRFSKDRKNLTLAPSQVKTPKQVEAEAERIFGKERPVGSKYAKTLKPFTKEATYNRPRIGRLELMTLLKNSPEFKADPYLIVQNDKSLAFNGKNNQFTIKPEALQLNADQLKVGDKIFVDEKLLSKTGQHQTRVFNNGQAMANVNVFSEDTPILSGSLQKTQAIQTPEMVELVKELTGQVPTMNKRLRTKLGVFFGRGAGEIQLKPEIFKDPVQVAKTLAHEIGHLVDWLPRFGVKRTSLLQKLYILKNHLRTEFGEEIVKNKDIKNELYALSTYWRPLGGSTDPGYLKYRNSGNELYADAISVLFNSPGLLEQRAPTFYKAFFTSLDQKPAVNEKYWEIQDLLFGAKEQLYEARENRIKAGFAKAEGIQKSFEEKKKKAESRLGERLRQQLDDRYWPINKKVQEAEAQGRIIDDSANPKYLLQEFPYINNENYLLVDKLNKEVSEPIRAAGMNDDDIGIYLLLDRIQGGRKDIANPFGFDVNNAAEQLNYLRQRVGESNYKLLQDKVAFFHDEVFKSVEKAVEVGSYNKEIYETTIKPNKQNYATFAVVDYLQDYVPAGVKKQIGTFKEVANPYHLTILKTTALNKLNASQEAKNSVRDFLQAEFPKEIEKSKEIRSGGMSIFKTNRDRGQLQMLEDGKLKSYDIDPYIARSFEYDDPDELNVAVKLLQRINQTFKSLVTTYNLGFAVAFNPIRDFKRNYKNIPNATLANLFKAYVESLPSAARYAKGQLDEITKQMVADKLISAPIHDFNYDPREDGMGDILAKYGVISRSTPESALPERMVAARKFLLKPVIKLLEAIRFTANTFESVSKIAATKIRRAGGEGGKELAYNIRNFSGTPNWKVRGLQTETTNELFIFSNIMKEGLKSDFLIATDPKTRSGYWWKTVKVDFLPKFLMFLAGAGVFGAWLKDAFDKMTEYDKTNYITIPLGKRNGKVVYARIPHDETGRIFSAILWKGLNFMKDRNVNGLQDILAVGAGQVPNITPVITILQAWGQYLTGRNPYDAFRGRTLLDDTTFQAGGIAGLKKMVEWTANTFGLSQFTTYDPNKNDTFETAVQVLPVVNRLFKVSDYGLAEQGKKVQNEIKTQRAREIVKEKEVISKYVSKNKDAYKAGDINIDDVGDQVVKDILGHEPETDAEFSRDKSIRTRLKRSMKVGAYDSRFDSLIYATSNQEKVVLLKMYRSQMAPDEFNDLVETSLDENIISGDVYDQIQ